MVTTPQTRVQTSIPLISCSKLAAPEAITALVNAVLDASPGNESFDVIAESDDLAVLACVFVMRGFKVMVNRSLGAIRVVRDLDARH